MEKKLTATDLQFQQYRANRMALLETQKQALSENLASIQRLLWSLSCADIARPISTDLQTICDYLSEINQ